MTAAANQWGIWRTGQWCGDGLFRSAAEQATISQDRNIGWNGYGYANYVPRTWMRRTCLKDDIATADDAAAAAITNNSGTSVSNLGSGFYSVTKLAAGVYDADAVSVGTVSGDVEVLLVYQGGTFIAGINPGDPTANSTYLTSIGGVWMTGTQTGLFSFGSQVGASHAQTGDFAKLVYTQSDDTLRYFVSADGISWGAALESYVGWGQGSTFHFDSSLNGAGSSFDAKIHPAPALNAYSLAASSGTFALTGSAAALKAGYRLAASSAAFTLTGTAVALKASRLLSASSGAFVLTGSAVGLKAGRYLSAVKGTFTLSGSAAALLAGRKLAASSGAFTLNGSALAFIHGFRLSAGSGAFVLSGSAATLAYHSVFVSGAFALAGSAVGMKLTRRLFALRGAFALSGKAVTLHKGRVMALAAGAFVFSGSSITMRHKQVAQAGRFKFYGKPVALRIAKTWFVPDNAPAGVAISIAPQPVAASAFVPETAPPAVRLEA